MFGGKAVKEGIVSTSAVKGNRKMTLNDTTGRIVDLAEEKVYDLDFKKKTYTGVTFAELRQQLKEAQEKAQREPRRRRKKRPARKRKSERAGQQKAPEMEVDFDVKETGQKKSIAGYDAREVVMTITVREKGKTLEDSGGLVVTSDMWLGPEIPAMRELAEFELRVLEGDRAGDAGDVPRADGRRRRDVPARQAGHGPPEPREGQHEGHAAPDGHDLRRGEERRADGQGNRVVQRRRPAAMSGMLARKMMKKDKDEQAARRRSSPSTQKRSRSPTSVSAADLEIPPASNRTSSSRGRWR